MYNCTVLVIKYKTQLLRFSRPGAQDASLVRPNACVVAPMRSMSTREVTDNPPRSVLGDVPEHTCCAERWIQNVCQPSVAPADTAPTQGTHHSLGEALAAWCCLLKGSPSAHWAAPVRRGCAGDAQPAASAAFTLIPGNARTVRSGTRWNAPHLFGTQHHQPFPSGGRHGTAQRAPPPPRAPATGPDLSRFRRPGGAFGRSGEPFHRRLPQQILQQRGTGRAPVGVRTRTVPVHNDHKLATDRVCGKVPVQLGQGATHRSLVHFREFPGNGCRPLRPATRHQVREGAHKTVAGLIQDHGPGNGEEREGG